MLWVEVTQHRRVSGDELLQVVPGEQIYVEFSCSSSLVCDSSAFLLKFGVAWSCGGEYPTCERWCKSLNLLQFSLELRLRCHSTVALLFSLALNAGPCQADSAMSAIDVDPALGLAGSPVLFCQWIAEDSFEEG